MEAVRGLFSVLCLVGLLVLGGCMAPDGGSGGEDEDGGRDDEVPWFAGGRESCLPVFWVGCDGNPDAVLLRDEYGLHQLTNLSGDEGPYGSPEGNVRVRIWGMEDGWVLGNEGGFGRPSERVVYDLVGGTRMGVATQGATPGGMWLSGREVFLGSRFGGDDGGVDQRFMVWSPLDGGIRSFDVDLEGTLGAVGFDGEWALIQISGSTAEPRHWPYFWAVHLDSGEHVLLAEGWPIEERRPEWRAISGYLQDGKVYLTWSRDEAGVSASYWRVEEVVLGSMERRVLWEDWGLESFKTEGGWLLLRTRDDGGSWAWVWFEEEGEWLERSPVAGWGVSRVAAVGGDWLVTNVWTEDLERVIMAGVHLPSGEVVEVAGWDSDFALTGMATDGEFVVVSMFIPGSEGFWSEEGPRFQFKGNQAQLYWVRLPEVP